MKLEPSLAIPSTLNSERTAVIVHLPDKKGPFRQVGDWQALSSRVHPAFAKMGIDAVLYLNHYALASNEKLKPMYQTAFSDRKIKHLVFITQNEMGYELVIGEVARSPYFIAKEKPLFYAQSASLPALLLRLGKEIKRAELVKQNFLIPEQPAFFKGFTVVEKSVLQNYPTILRRNKLVVERFGKLSKKGSNEAENQYIDAYNDDIDQKNQTFETLMSSYPYEYEFIDPTSDEDLLKKRYQFVLRAVSGEVASVRQMLGYADVSKEEYASTLPVMPDQTKDKSIPKDALVYKFYIRQNVSKNIHVGVWDADVSWQQALQNMIGNLTQEHQLDR